MEYTECEAIKLRSENALWQSLRVISFVFFVYLKINKKKVTFLNKNVLLVIKNVCK